jgi:hypothetical protein
MEFPDFKYRVNHVLILHNRKIFLGMRPAKNVVTFLIFSVDPWWSLAHQSASLSQSLIIISM